MRTQLLCTFADNDDLDITLTNIENQYSIVFNYIYVLEDVDDSDNLFITYNIELAQPRMPHLSNTILIHRKKETNTIYTINALNVAISTETGGIVDKTHKLNWENYRNSILLTSDGGIRKIRTKVKSVIDLE